jgi:hypothetical protein
VVFRFFEGGKMNDKPKDRTTKRMNIIAIILVLISALGNLIYGIVTGENGISARFLVLCVVLLVTALRREAVAGFFFLIFGLFGITFVGVGIWIDATHRRITIPCNLEKNKRT